MPTVPTLKKTQKGGSEPVKDQTSAAGSSSIWESCRGPGWRLETFGVFRCPAASWGSCKHTGPGRQAGPGETLGQRGTGGAQHGTVAMKALHGLCTHSGLGMALLHTPPPQQKRGPLPIYSYAVAWLPLVTQFPRNEFVSVGKSLILSMLERGQSLKRDKSGSAIRKQRLVVLSDLDLPFFSVSYKNIGAMVRINIMAEKCFTAQI